MEQEFYTPKIKICGITNITDALYSANMGADAIGLRIRPKTNADEIIEIVNKLPPFITPVLLLRGTDSQDPQEIAQLLHYLGISTIQIYSQLNQANIKILRNLVPNIKVIIALGISGPESIKLAISLERFADALLLDSQNQHTGIIGGTGLTHDWEISRQINDCVKKPVILAGGLNDKNIQKAIYTVNPWGVDCETSVEYSDGIKDQEKLEKFLLAAKNVPKRHSK